MYTHVASPEYVGSTTACLHGGRIRKGEAENIICNGEFTKRGLYGWTNHLTYTHPTKSHEDDGLGVSYGDISRWTLVVMVIVDVPSVSEGLEPVHQLLVVYFVHGATAIQIAYHGNRRERLGRKWVLCEWISPPH